MRRSVITGVIRVGLMSRIGITARSYVRSRPPRRHSLAEPVEWGQLDPGLFQPCLYRVHGGRDVGGLETDPGVCFEPGGHIADAHCIWLDEVHLLPAPVFRITAEIQATRRLGLTATLVREDGQEEDVFTLIGLVVAGVVSLLFINESTDFARLVTIDNFTTFFRVLFIATAVVLIIGSHEYIERHVNHVGEFYALILLSTVGAMFMASARDLLTAYLSIEVLSFSLYVAVSLAKGDVRSGEATLKYVLLGGVASAMLLVAAGWLAVLHVTRAGERLPGSVFVADRHQRGHLALGDGDFLASPFGKSEVGDAVVGEVRLGCIHVMAPRMKFRGAQKAKRPHRFRCERR